MYEEVALLITDTMETERVRRLLKRHDDNGEPFQATLSYEEGLKGAGLAVNHSEKTQGLRVSRGFTDADPVERRLLTHRIRASRNSRVAHSRLAELSKTPSYRWKDLVILLPLVSLPFLAGSMSSWSPWTRELFQAANGQFV